MDKPIYLKSTMKKSELQSTTIRNAVYSIVVGLGVLLHSFSGYELPEGLADQAGQFVVGLSMVWFGLRCRLGRKNATQQIGKQ